MAGLRALQRCQGALDPLLQSPEALLETMVLVARALRVLGRAKLRDTGLQLQEGPLELKLVPHTRRVYCRGRAPPRLSPAAPRRRVRTAPWPAPRLPARRGGRGRKAAWVRDAPRRSHAATREAPEAPRCPPARGSGSTAGSRPCPRHC